MEDANPVGRPSELTPELIESCKKYYEEAKSAGQGNEKFFPTIGGLANYLDVARWTLHRWRKENKEFSVILEKILALQEDLLIKGGLFNKYNSTITKLILTKHGYNDKAEVDMTTKGKSMNPGLENLSKEELEQAIARLNEEGSTDAPKE